MAAAVPGYVGTRFLEAPPGHRSRLYFDGWESDWRLPKEKSQIVARFTALPPQAREGLSALVRRQTALAVGRDDTHVVDASSVAPFVTGLGIEHPLENGFAFVDPHGLPVLPGSSVKGVVRRVAEELALFEDDARGWTVAAVWALFGFDASAAYLRPAPKENDGPLVAGEREHWRSRYLAAVESGRIGDAGSILAQDDAWRKRWEKDAAEAVRALQGSTERESLKTRGALEFWDVYPDPGPEGLRVDVMAPHFGAYHQQDAARGPVPAPADKEDPKPIFFLTLPAGTRFRFHVRIRAPRAVAELVPDTWRDLLNAALTRAFEELGFGAKTSSGYGRLSRDTATEARRKEDEERRLRQVADADLRTRLESLEPVERMVVELDAFSLERHDEQRMSEIFKEVAERLSGEDRLRVARALRAAYDRIEKWPGPKRKLAKRQKEKVAKLKEILGEP